MTEDRDPLLQTLFAEAHQELDGEVFISGVLDQIRSQRNPLAAGAVCGALLFAAAAWIFALPLLEIAQLITTALSITLVDLGQGWIFWILSPINNIASVLVLAWKAMRIIRNKILNASYANF